MTATAPTCEARPARLTSEFEIVFACVDNRTRAILGQHLLRRALHRNNVCDVSVVAAGGHKFNAGDAIDTTASAQLAHRGIHVEREVPIQLKARHLRSSDLLLTFEREHRTELYQYDPRMLTHAFTLPELAAISRAAPELAALPRRERARAAARLRVLGVDAPDIPETWNQPPDACVAAAKAIENAVADLIVFLA